MPYRRPTRFLAPVALIAAVLAIYFVAKPFVDDQSSSSSGSTVSTGTTGKKKSTAKKRKSRIYVVKKGDTLGGISEKTGVSVQDLSDRNDIDAQNLDVGQRLKLGP